MSCGQLTLAVQVHQTGHLEQVPTGLSLVLAVAVAQPESTA
ncbi:hypothetical protein OHV05_35860 (plasmid) [Kitasatospora sp. NBC_00070]